MGQRSEPGAGLVSIVLPTYNRVRTLERAVNSVLNQSYAAVELIIVDDGSTDGTRELVASFDDARIRFVPLDQNRGVSHARNTGLRLATGEYIAFQDSDDEWLAGKLEQQVNAARAAAAKHPAVCVFHTKIMYVAGSVLGDRPNMVFCIPALPRTPSREYLLRSICRHNLISTQTLLMNRAALQRVHGFDELLANNEDWDFAISLIRNTEAVFLDEPLVMTYLQDDSVSHLTRRGARSQLRIALKLLRDPDVDRQVVGNHLSAIGWWISKLGNPKLARAPIFKAVSMSPGDWKSWARLVASEMLVMRSRFTSQKPRAAQSTLNVRTAARPVSVPRR